MKPDADLERGAESVRKFLSKEEWEMCECRQTPCICATMLKAVADSTEVFTQRQLIGLRELVLSLRAQLAQARRERDEARNLVPEGGA